MTEPRATPRDLAGARRSVASVLAAVRRRDRGVAAGVMAAGLAFRLFLILLPMALLLSAAVGFSARFGGLSVEDSIRRFGVVGTLLPQMAVQVDESRRGRWLLLGAGLLLLFYTTHGFFRVLTLVNARLWDDRPRSSAAARAGVPLLLIAQLLCGALVSAITDEAPALALPAELVLAIVTFAIWTALFGLLPHLDAPLKALLPGAAVVAVVLAVMHLATVELYGPWVSRPGQLYGTLGTIAGLMAWLFIGSRMIVAAITLNACMWELRAGTAAGKVEVPTSVPAAPAS